MLIMRLGAFGSILSSQEHHRSGLSILILNIRSGISMLLFILQSKLKPGLQLRLLRVHQLTTTKVVKQVSNQYQLIKTVMENKMMNHKTTRSSQNTGKYNSIDTTFKPNDVHRHPACSEVNAAALGFRRLLLGSGLPALLGTKQKG